MFNRRGHFNRMHYNRPRGGIVILRQFVNFSTHLNAAVRSGSSLYVSIAADAQLGASSRAAAKTYGQIKNEGILLSSARMISTLHETTIMNTTLQTHSSMGSRYYPSVTANSELSSSTLLGAKYYEAISMQNALLSASRMGAVYYEPVLMATALLLAQVDSLSLDVEEAVISVSIPPGGVLVIDSYDYLVTLNNKNAMDYQSGDWLFVDRELFDVQIYPLYGGSLEEADVNITYDTRYL